MAWQNKTTHGNLVDLANLRWIPKNRICKRDFLPPSMSLLGIFVEFPGCDHLYTVKTVCCLIEFLIFSVLGD